MTSTIRRRTAPDRPRRPCARQPRAGHRESGDRLRRRAVRGRAGAAGRAGRSRATPRRIRAVRFHQGRPIVALEGVETMNDAEALAGPSCGCPAPRRRRCRRDVLPARPRRLRGARRRRCGRRAGDGRARADRAAAIWWSKARGRGADSARRRRSASRFDLRRGRVIDRRIDRRGMGVVVATEPPARAVRRTIRAIDHACFPREDGADAPSFRGW